MIYITVNKECREILDPVVGRCKNLIPSGLIYWSLCCHDSASHSSCLSSWEGYGRRSINNRVRSSRLHIIHRSLAGLWGPFVLNILLIYGILKGRLGNIISKIRVREKKTKTSQMIQCSIHSKQILLHRSIPGRESDLGRIIGLTSVGPFFMQKRGCWFEVKTFQKVGSRGSLSLPRIKSSSVGQRRSLEDWLVLVFISQGTAKYKSQLVKSYVNTCRKCDPYAQ